MKKNILFAVFAALTFALYGQESNIALHFNNNESGSSHRVRQSEKKNFIYKIIDRQGLKKIAVLNANGSVEVLTHDKNEIHLSVEKRFRKNQYDSNLKPLYGRNDNTDGIGFSIVESGSIISIQNLDIRHLEKKPIIKVVVPINIPLKITLLKDQPGDLSIIDFPSDLEITGNQSNINLNGLNSSLVLSSGGKIDVSYKSVEENKSISILSTENKDLLISMPSDSEVSLSLQSEMGQILTDFDVIPNENDDAWEWSKILLGTINGGGTTLNAQSVIGNIIIKKN